MNIQPSRLAGAAFAVLALTLAGAAAAQERPGEDRATYEARMAKADRDRAQADEARQAALDRAAARYDAANAAAAAKADAAAAAAAAKADAAAAAADAKASKTHGPQ